MAQNINTRLEALEANKTDDHDWTIKIFLDDHDHLQTKHYKDGAEVGLAQYHREFKPKQGDPIKVKITK